MYKFCLILLISVLTFGCKVKQVVNFKPGYENLCVEFNKSEPLVIQINYLKVRGCIISNHFDEKITIQSYKNKVWITHFTKNSDYKIYGPFEGNVLQIVHEFEEKARANIPCGGYSRAGTGVLISLKINYLSDEFAYCEDRWDGFHELLRDLNSMTKKSN